MSEDSAKRSTRRRRATTRAGRRRSLRVPGDDVPREGAADEDASTFDAFDEDDAEHEESEADVDIDEDDDDEADVEERVTVDGGGPEDGDDMRPTREFQAVTPTMTPDDEKTIPRIDVTELQRDSEVDDAVTNPHIELASMQSRAAMQTGSVVISPPAQIISDAPYDPPVSNPPTPTPAATLAIDEPDDAFLDEESVATQVGIQAPDLDARDAAATAGQAEAALPSMIIDPSISLPPPEPTTPAPVSEESVPEATDPEAAAAAESVEVPAPPLDAAVTLDESPLKAVEPIEPVAEQVAVEAVEELEELVDVDEEGELADVEGPHSRSRTPPPPPPDARAKPAPPPPPPAKQGDAKARRKRARQWWERFFSEDYLISVLPPTAAQVARQVDFIEASLGLSDGATVLDVGCGLGMHAIELTRRGHLVVGLDLSLTMITRAAESAQESNLKINFLHADIREIEFEGTFDAVICMGTTFGFFDDEANLDVLSRLHQALKPGGRILLDVANRDYVINSQPNLVWFEGDECVCMEESDFNYFSSRLMVKRTMMREDGQQSQAEYSIRLYSLHELGQLMQQKGFRVLEVSGQEATRGVFFGAQSSRVLILAERRIAGRKSVVMPPERVSGEVAKPPPKA